MLNETILLSDVGGTNIRFALYRQGELSPIMTYRTASGKSYTDYIDAFLHDLGQQDDSWKRPDSAIIGAAGLIENGVVHSKNCPVRLSQSEIMAWGFNSVDIENDFVTQSRAVKSSNIADFIWSSDKDASLDGTIMVIGPGTGLGMSVIRESHKKRMLPQAAEAGFTSVPLLDGVSDEQNQTIEVLRDYMKREHASRLVYDHIVSGSGLVRLYYARRHLENIKKCPDLVFSMPRVPIGAEKNVPASVKKKYGLRLTAQEICEMSQNGSRTAEQAVSYFLRYLGRFAGDQANIHLPDKIIFAGGVMCDSLFQEKLLNPNGLFMQEYRAARLKGGKQERLMGICKNRSVAFNGLIVAAKEKLRKNREDMLLSMTTFDSLIHCAAFFKTHEEYANHAQTAKQDESTYRICLTSNPVVNSCNQYKVFSYTGNSKEA